MAEEVRHITENGKYRIVFEQAASTKGTIGFKVEVNGDIKEDVEAEATELLSYAKAHAPMQPIEEKKVKE